MKKICIGIDISKETFDVTVVFAPDTATVDKMGYEKFANRRSGFRSLVSWTKRLCKQNSGATLDDCLYCMETTGGYDRQICQYLYEKGLHVWRESALQIRRSSGFRRGKSDKADSLNIAVYAAKHQERLVEYEPDPKSLQELKELICFRNTLVEKKKQCSNRLKNKCDTMTDKSSDTYKLIQRLTKEEVKETEDKIKQVEDQIEKVISSDKTLAKHYQHAKSFKGVGLVTASSVIAFSGDFKKILTPNKMSVYCGGVTFYEDSGTSIHKKDPSKNVCCKMLKNILHMAAKSAMRHNADIKAYADRLTKKGKPYGVVLNNVANKILHIMYSLIKHDCDFEEAHEAKRKAATDGKAA